MGWAGVLCSSPELKLAAARTWDHSMHSLPLSLSTIASIIVIPGPVATKSTLLRVCTVKTLEIMEILTKKIAFYGSNLDFVKKVCMCR